MFVSVGSEDVTMDDGSGTSPANLKRTGEEVDLESKRRR
jgi:hypothetical protein